MSDVYAGKVVLITGAAVRLGAAMARALAERGCDVILHYHKSRAQVAALADELRALGRRTVVLKAALDQPAGAARLAGAAQQAFGRVDILVNNAAIFRPSSLARLDGRDFDAFIGVNLRSPYVLSSTLGRQMKARGAGLIVNLACISALRPWQDYLPYSISKAGLVALTQGLAKLLAPQVRVNAIAPGTVLPAPKTSRRELQALQRQIPLKRTGSAQDIVRALLYLCEADFVTGEVLRVDGGRNLV